MDQQKLKTIHESHEPNAVPPSNVGELEVMDQRQLKTIQDSHEPNDVHPANVGRLESSMPDCEKEGGPVISENLKIVSC
jgi:hypothetical protein